MAWSNVIVLAQIGGDGDCDRPSAHGRGRASRRTSWHRRPYHPGRHRLNHPPTPSSPTTAAHSSPEADHHRAGCDPSREGCLWRRLDQSLPVDHSFAMLGILAPPSIGFQHRGLRLLDLQEQRIGLIAPDEQDDPCARAHTADSDDLAGDIDVAILLHELAAVDERASAGSCG